jgi:hypothetical protein
LRLSLLEIQKQIVRIRIPRIYTPPRNVIRRGLFRFMQHKWFERFNTTVLLTNVVILALPYFGMTPWYEELLSTPPPLPPNSSANLNIAFIVYFLIEMTLKVLAFGPADYLYDIWNRFEALVNVLSVLGLFLEISFATGKEISLIRIIRAVRVLRLIRGLKGLNFLFQTILYPPNTSSSFNSHFIASPFVCFCLNSGHYVDQSAAHHWRAAHHRVCRVRHAGGVPLLQRRTRRVHRRPRELR